MAQGELKRPNPSFAEVMTSYASFRKIGLSADTCVQAKVWALNQPQLHHLSTRAKLNMLVFSISQMVSSRTTTSPSRRTPEKVLWEDYGIKTENVWSAGQFMASGEVDKSTWETFTTLTDQREAQLLQTDIDHDPIKLEMNRLTRELKTADEVIEIDQELTRRYWGRE